MHRNSLLCLAISAVVSGVTSSPLAAQDEPVVIIVPGGGDCSRAVQLKDTSNCSDPPDWSTWGFCQALESQETRRLRPGSPSASSRACGAALTCY